MAVVEVAMAVVVLVVVVVVVEAGSRKSGVVTFGDIWCRVPVVLAELDINEPAKWLPVRQEP